MIIGFYISNYICSDNTSQKYKEKTFFFSIFDRLHI